VRIVDLRPLHINEVGGRDPRLVPFERQAFLDLLNRKCQPGGTEHRCPQSLVQLDRGLDSTAHDSGVVGPDPAYQRNRRLVPGDTQGFALLAAEFETDCLRHIPFLIREKPVSSWCGDVDTDS
jgi:hypothetical protein